MKNLIGIIFATMTYLAAACALADDIEATSIRLSGDILSIGVMYTPTCNGTGLSFLQHGAICNDQEPYFCFMRIHRAGESGSMCDVTVEETISGNLNRFGLDDAKFKGKAIHLRVYASGGDPLGLEEVITIP
mgnify:CR=1 FL=1